MIPFPEVLAPVILGVLWFAYVRWLQSRPPLPRTQWVAGIVTMIGATIWLLTSPFLAISGVREAFPVIRTLSLVGRVLFVIGMATALVSVMPGPRKRSSS
jgi:hypothetical protein